VIVIIVGFCSVTKYACNVYIHDEAIIVIGLVGSEFPQFDFKLFDINYRCDIFIPRNPDVKFKEYQTIPYVSAVPMKTLLMNYG